MKSFITCLLLGFLSGSAFSQKLSLAADKNKILIGEPFRIEFRGEFSKGQDFSWPAVDSIAHFEILERGKIDTVQKEPFVVLSQKLTLTSWDSGKWMIPSLVLGKGRSEPIPIDVHYSDADPNQPYHDVKDILEVKKPVQSVWWWYIVGLALLLALFLLFFPKGKKKEQTAFVPDEGAYKVALKKLDQLKKQEQKDPKIFYTELIQIFREYLQRRKNIQSFSKTTDDLAIQIEQLKMEREQYKSLLQELRLSDLVKFARFHPAQEENEAALDVIRKSIITIEQN